MIFGAWKICWCCFFVFLVCLFSGDGVKVWKGKEGKGGRLLSLG